MRFFQEKKFDRNSEASSLCMWKGCRKERVQRKRGKVSSLTKPRLDPPRKLKLCSTVENGDSFSITMRTLNIFTIYTPMIINWINRFTIYAHMIINCIPFKESLYGRRVGGWWNLDQVDTHSCPFTCLYSTPPLSTLIVFLLLLCQSEW